MSYKIGSLNILGSTEFGSRDENDDSVSKNPELIAKIILDAGLDILALQEFKPRSKEKNRKDIYLLEGILKYLNLGKGEWLAARAPEYTTGREQAYIWNNKRITCLARYDAEPKVYSKEMYQGEYKVKYVLRDPQNLQHSTQWYMKRDPYIARFIPNPNIIGPKPYCEIRLINVHLWHGAKYEAFENLNQRKEEYSLVTTHIHDVIDDVVPVYNNKPYFTQRNAQWQESLFENNIVIHNNVIDIGNLRSVFTIVLGDYNIEYGTCSNYDIENGNNKTKTVMSEKTTLKKYSKAGERVTSDDYSKNYDHFSYAIKKEDVVKIPAYRIDTVYNYTNGDFTEHLVKISDHVPIVIEIF